MKTRELIENLQKIDPSGSMEVCCNNTDILFLNKLPGYYDGCYQVLIRDNRSGFNVTGGTIVAVEEKIQIVLYSIEDLLMDYPDAPVIMDSEYAANHYGNLVKQWRAGE